MILAALLLAAGPVAGAPPPTPSSRFTPADAFRLAYARDVQISPDGRTIAYVRITQDIMTDAGRSEIWLIDVASGRQTALGVSDSNTPRWSSDGTRLAYLVKDRVPGKSLRILTIANGATRAIDTGDKQPETPVWSPDGTLIAFVAARPVPSAQLGVLPDKPEGAAWADPVEIIERANYRADGEGDHKPDRRHIFVVSSAGGELRQITSGDTDNGDGLVWTPDGRHLMFSADHGLDKDLSLGDSDIMSVDLTSLAIVQLTYRAGPDGEPAVSPDGRLIAFTGYDEKRSAYRDQQLSVMNADGTGVRVLTARFDRSVEAPRWAADGRSIYVAYQDKGSTKVARVTLDGTVRNVATGLMDTRMLDRPYAGGEFSVARDGRIAFAGNVVPRPPEVMLTDHYKPRILTNVNQDLFAGKDLGMVTPLKVRSSVDGRAIDAWMLTPPNFDPHRTYPAILEIHGGPNAAYGPSWSTTDQLFAQAGYIVVYSNPRGSISYGQGFADLINHAFPSQDYDDLMSVVDTAIATGRVDATNLFVTGGSGGGLLSAWIVAHTKRFRAAVAQKPVMNWLSEALTSDVYPYMVRNFFARPPWEDPMAYWRSSPLSVVGDVTTPTAMIVGSLDTRTPPGEAEQFYNALKLRGVPTMLVRVPGAGHRNLTSRPSQLIGQFNATLGWFERYRVSPPVLPAAFVPPKPPNNRKIRSTQTVQ